MFFYFPAISMRLSFNTKEILEKEIPKVLRNICDEDNYKETEFNPSKVRRACKQLLSKYNEVGPGGRYTVVHS